MENESHEKNPRLAAFCSVFVWVIPAGLPIVNVAPKYFEYLLQVRNTANDAPDKSTI
jgi:hypothetical protein